MRALLALTFGCTVAACGGQGTFDLQLVLPQDPTLRPTGMTTVTVTLTQGDQPPVATTSVLDGTGSFSAGDLAVADDVRIDVQLRDVSNRLVGVGEAPDPIDILANESTTVVIPVRRPFVYTSNGAALFSFDPTLDATDGDFQGQLMGVSGAPQVVVSVGGDRLAVVSSNAISVFATDTNKAVGMPIALQGTTRDAAYIPGTRRVAVASDQGISIVDIDTAAVQVTTVAGVERITVGPTADGRLLAHGLVGRVAPEVNPLLVCSGTSSIVTIDVDSQPASATAKPLSEAVSDIAAAPENVGLFATLPCSGRVARITGDIESGAPTFEDFATLSRASVLAVAGGRVIAAGTQPSRPMCSPSCQPTSSTSCTGGTPSSKVNFVDEGANLIVLSIPIAGGMPVTIDLPDRRETLLDESDPANAHAQVLTAFGTVPLDLVALPGGQHVGIVTASNYYIEELQDQGFVVLPCLNATTADWLLLDLASGSLSSRVRTSCSLEVGQADLFPDWKCDLPPPGEQSAFGEYVPLSVGALFGAR